MQLCFGALDPAWAQRRRNEPEVSPQFQQSSGSPSDAGSPLGGPTDPGPGGPSPGLPGSEDPFPPRDPQGGVQIGAAAPQRSAPQAPTNPLDTRIVVRVKNAPLSTFLDTISAQARVNFIITEGLEAKRITAFLQNVTVREALQVLLEMKGLTYQRIGRSNTYVVAPRRRDVPNRITRIYQLNYIPLVPIDEVAEGGGQNQNNDLQQQLQQQQQQQQGQQGGRISGAASGGGIPILLVLRSVLTRLGDIALDARTNSLIVTDVPEVFPQIEQILAELDRKAPQVIIEAQIVEIDSTRVQELGLEWGGPNGEIARFSGPLRDTTFPLNLPENMNNFHFFDPVDELPTTRILSGSGAGGGGGAGGAAGGGVTGGGAGLGTGGGGTAEGGGGAAAQAVQGLVLRSGFLDLTQLSVLLRALVSRAEARFLGKPKVLTINNKRAQIAILADQAVSLRLEQATAGTGGAVASVTVERVNDVGLRLNVTPQINKEGYITLLIQPQFTDVVQSALTNQGQPVFDPIRRSASTLVRVKNGQTLVLGGLLQSRETKTVRKVPLLGYIPLIGWLFTSTSSRRINTDLVIFITPTIVND